MARTSRRRPGSRKRHSGSPAISPMAMFTVQPSSLAQTIRTVRQVIFSCTRTVLSGRSIAYRRRRYKADAGVWGVDCHRWPPSIIWKCSMHGTNGRPAPPCLLASLLSAKTIAMGGNERVFRKLDLETWVVLELRARAASVSVACERSAYHPPMSARPARLSDQSLSVVFWPIQAHPRGGARRLHPLDSASGRLVEAAPSPISFAAWGS